MSLPACPSLAELRAFHVGDLSEAVLSDVAAHLESCALCEAAAQTLDHLTDPVMAAYRRSVQNAPPPVAMPTRVGDYDVIGEIGRGGMGVVYRARHRRLGREVALKMLLRGIYAEPEEKARFRAEAEAVARLQQPNIVQLYEFGEHDAGDGQLRPYFTLEFVDGESLSARLAGRPLPPRQAAAWVEIVARAVQFAHEHGVVHRDLKPSNILLAADGQPKLCDFGVAKLLTGSDLKTLSGAVLGTVEYMAPEQAAGDAAVGPPADIYALGAILYASLTGRPPFQGTNSLLTLEQVRQQEPVAPRLLVPQVPRDLNTICLKCLQKKSASRYPSAAALAEDLRRFLAGEPIIARPVTTWERAWKWARRRPALAALLALSLAVITIGFPAATALWLKADRARESADRARDQLEGAVYAGNTALADHAYQDTEVEVARDLLAHCLPEPGRPDRRNWEWWYLNRLCRSDLLPDLGHSDHPDHWVYALAIHPDGHTLVSAVGLPYGSWAGRPLNASEVTPGEIRVWDVQTGKRLATLKGHSGSLRAAVFSPDGRWLVTGSDDGRVKLWDGHTFADRGDLPAEDGRASALTFTSDGRYLIVRTLAAVAVWDVVARSRRAIYSSAQPNVHPVLAIDPDGRVVIAEKVGADRSALVRLDVESGREVDRQIQTEPVYALAFSRDGRFRAIARGDKRVQLWDATGAHLLRSLAGHTNEITVLAFCADGRLASAGDDRTIRIFDPESGREVCQYRGHTIGVQSLAVSADGRWLASGDKSGSIKVWNLQRDPRGVSFPGVVGRGEYLDDLAFSADGQSILVVADQAGETDVHNLARWDAATGRLQGRHTLNARDPKESWHRIYAISGDGRRLAGADWSGLRTAAIFDVADGRKLATVRSQDVQITSVALDRTAARISFGGWKKTPTSDAATSHSVSAELVVADATTGEEVYRPILPPGTIITPVAISPDGRRVASAIREAIVVGDNLTRAPTASVMIWTVPDLPGAKAPNPITLEGPFDGSIVCLSFNVEGDRLAAAGVDNTVRVWDANTGRPAFAAIRDSRPATGLAFSPDGRRLAATSMDGLVRLWDARNGERLLTLRGLGPPGTGHYGFTGRVAFSPDGTRIAANDWDGTVTVWDASVPDRGIEYP
jgi:WD40 repeat protein/tRNA A-37 threonylcarbamoyl transferase component Bud32